VRKYKDTATRVRAPLVTGYGGQRVRDWPNATRTPIERCSIQPDSQTEITDRRQTTVTTWKLFAPADTDLLATDRIESTRAVDDAGKALPLEVAGEVERWRTYVSAVLSRVTEG
jgi:hypothetical protein